MPIAKSIQDVILGEAAYTGISDVTYADMMGIASVINNRAIALGVPAQDVVSVQGEFNAFGNRLPAGVNAYREMAEKAWADVVENGSITKSTFYSTPAATQNLPSGLVQEAAVPGGHVYFSDPLERSIKTAVGYRQPADISAVRAQVEQRLATDAEFGGSIPTPASAPEQGDEAVSEAGFDQSRFGDRPAPESFAAGMQAQRMTSDTMVSAPDVASFDASRFGARPTPTGFAEAMTAQRDFTSPADQALSAGFDTSRFGARPTPEGFAAAMAAQRTVAQPSFDMARLDPGPALSEADKALQDAMQTADAATRAAYVDPSRFAEPSVASDPFSSVMAPQEVAVSKALMSPVSLENVQAPSTNFTPTDSTVLGPEAALNVVDNRFVPSDVQAVEAAQDVTAATGINSPEHKALQAQVEKQLENPSISNPDPNAALSVPSVSTPVDVASVTTDVTAPDPNAIAAVAADQATIAGIPDVASMTTDVTAPSSTDTRTESEIAADFAQEVGAQKTSRITPQDQVRMETQMQTPAALETVDVAEQPSIAEPDEVDPNAALSTPTVTAPAVTTAITQSASNPMQSAADRALGTAMGVWNGEVQTGTATDGSTVSRLEDGRVARYNPKYDQTEYTSDEGAHWTGLVEGNKIPGLTTPAANPNAALSTPSTNPFSKAVSVVSPGGLLGGGILGKIVGLLSGLGSPTGVATAGTDGGARVADHGAPGEPGGYGPGGTGSSAGGYGSTQGKDPAGTY